MSTTKLIIEIELESAPSKNVEFPFPSVKSVKVDGKEVEKQLGTSGRTSENFWDLRGVDDGMILVVSESWY